MKDIKLVVFDLDGTLLNNSGKLFPRTREVIDNLRKQGIMFSLASGRNVCIMKDFVEELNIDLPYISDNGANIYQKDKNIKSFIIDSSYNNFILKTMYEEGIPFNAYSDKGNYFNSSSLLFEKVRKRFVGKTVVQDFVWRDYSNENFFKFTLDSADYNNIEELVKKVVNVCPNISMKRSEDSFYTIVAKDVDKGVACLALCEMLKIDSKAMMCFGDNHNDVSMLKVAGVSICPENARDEIKKDVTYVCGDNNEEGVIKFLEEYFKV